MRAGDRVGVAVSGGADSVALLRLLLEIRASLGVVPAVVHFNHKLRGEESDADERFVRELAAEHGLEFFGGSGDTRAHAAEHKCGIEAAARELRYEFFWEKLKKSAQCSVLSAQQGQATLDRIATAHTMDDQAETVVLRFLRGAGTRGLAGVHPVVGEDKRGSSDGPSTLAQDDKSKGAGSVIVRPLLDFRRAQLRHYLKRKGQSWREDTSNQDPGYARNRLRRDLMPKLREFNPSIEQVLSETAEIARAEEEYWREQVASRRPHVAADDADGRWSMVDGKALLQLPVALQRRVLREAAEQNGARLEFHHVQQMLDVLSQESSRSEKTIELPGEIDAAIVERELRFRSRCPKQQELGYEIPLMVPGEVEVPAAGLIIATRLLERGEGKLLDPEQVGSLRVRNWRPGDRYWPGHTREPKKLKELLQSRHVPAGQRGHWPVVIGERNGKERIVWVPGFSFPEQLLLTNGSGPGLMLEHRARG